MHFECDRGLTVYILQTQTSISYQKKKQKIFFFESILVKNVLQKN